MSSAIDIAVPVFGSPTTASVRDNFRVAAEEISALQDAVDLGADALDGLRQVVAALAEDAPYLPLAGGTVGPTIAYAPGTGWPLRVQADAGQVAAMIFAETNVAAADNWNVGRRANGNFYVQQNSDRLTIERGTGRLIVPGPAEFGGNLTVGGSTVLGPTTMTGLLTLSGDPTAALGAATRQYVDALRSYAAATYLPLAGGAMTGFLTLSAEPTADRHAATKAYVDASSGNVGGPFLELAGGTLYAPGVNTLLRLRADTAPGLLFHQTGSTIAAQDWLIGQHGGGNFQIRQDGVLPQALAIERDTHRLMVAGPTEISNTLWVLGEARFLAGITGPLAVTGLSTLGSATIYAPGGAWPFRVQADAGLAAAMIFQQTGLPNVDNWNIGRAANGNFFIQQSTHWLTIQPNTGRLIVPGPAEFGSVTATGEVTANGLRLNDRTLGAVGSWEWAVDQATIRLLTPTGTQFLGINTSTASFAGAVTAGGGLTVTGGALTAGTVSVSGGITSAGLTVNGHSNLVGNLGVSGTVTGGQGVFDAGFRVFSPVNPPPASRAADEEVERLTRWMEQLEGRVAGLEGD